MAKEIKYNIPQETKTTMASEPVSAYASQPTVKRVVLSVEQEFRRNLDNWLFCTGMYSGPNLCWDNEPFRNIEAMGRITLPMIDNVRESYPDYTHRHLRWLREKLQS